MNVKVIKTKIDKGGVIHIVDKELPAGDADIVVFPYERSASSAAPRPINLPIGGYKAGWLSPRQLRRESIYEDA